MQSDVLFDWGLLGQAYLVGVSIAAGGFVLLGMYLYVRSALRKQVRIWMWQLRQKRKKRL